MRTNIIMYIATMAIITYLIRVIPLLVLRKPINNVLIKSFLYYVPYITLTVMTFPAILSATNSYISALIAFIIAIIAAYKKCSLLQVACIACITVFIIEMFI